MSIQLKSFVCFTIALLLTTATALLQPASPVLADPIDEVEPNDTAETAQALSVIGAANPVNAAINAAGDQDWYSFEMEAGETYVIELFNVDNSLNVSGRYICSNVTYRGLGLLVYSPSLTEVAQECNPSGAGNVQSILQFTANFDGVYYIKVIPNSNTVFGSYSLRVLPKYDEPNASWDETTFEPNNQARQAYAITLGRANALTSEIEERNTSYSTNTTDMDWYRFEAEAGKTYVIELFNVDSSFNASGRYICSNVTYSGLGLLVYDPLFNHVTTQCNPQGAGNVQSIVQFTANFDGAYHIKVIPNANTVFGNYNIRVLPEYDDPNASWDETTFEPNNRASHAYAITLGQANALTSEISQRSANYNTNTTDMDWYRFEAEASKTYVVELFNVDNNLAASGRYICSNVTYSGLGLKVYDPFLGEVASQCNPSGGGNVQSILQFTANFDGVYHIKVIPNANTVFGSYGIRVLPKYDHPNASWDATTFEPNNRSRQAYALTSGNALTSQIEQRTVNYSTNAADVDWYRFDAQAGQTYVIELFNVESTITSTSGRECENSTRSGLGLKVYDPSVTYVAGQCRPNESGGLHNTAQFRADFTGYITSWSSPTPMWRSVITTSVCMVFRGFSYLLLCDN